MKRKLAVVLTAALASAMLLTGCGSKNDASNEYVTITGYKGIEVAAVEDAAEVTDEDVQSYISSVLEEHATEELITDRPVQEGDTAIITYVGKMDGVEFEGGSAEDYPLVIGSNSFIAGFEDSIIGHSVGETFDWNGQFPEDYTPELAGKPVVFTITVNAIAVYTTPELTDELVQTLSETAKTVADYEEEIRTMLEESTESDYKYALQDAVWNAVMEKAEVVKYPEGQVEEVASTLIAQYEEMATYYGVDY